LSDRPLASLLGRYRDSVAIYGSGGFTSDDDGQLARQLAGWVETEGCRFVKMKIGSEPERDPARVAVAKAAIGAASLFVDANGAYDRRQSQYLAAKFAAREDVRRFEEPVSSDDLAGLRQVREHAPDHMEIAAGECPASAPLRRIRGFQEGRISGSS
jgi:L-alanine-DL-glutamate epimerase-like enolase superfamily enzyme